MDALSEKEGYPIYYKDFSCIADKCKNSCCIGWEIDIDEDTEEFYKNLEGSYAEEIRSSIVKDEEGAHFRLCENGNCPHLNEKGLCNIITEYSDAALCDICALHPRFRNFFTGYTETGLGLSCEEVARIIVKADETFHIVADSSFDEMLSDEEKEIIEIREDVFMAINYRELKLSERMVYLGREFGFDFKKMKPDKLIDIYLSLERLDDAWTDILKDAKGERFDFELVDSQDLTEAFTQLLAYFIFRHFPKALSDGDMVSKIKFSIFAVLLLSLLMNKHKKENRNNKINHLIEYARIFSSEIEYSEENTDRLFEIL